MYRNPFGTVFRTDREYTGKWRRSNHIGRNMSCATRHILIHYSLIVLSDKVWVVICMGELSLSCQTVKMSLMFFNCKKLNCSTRMIISSCTTYIIVFTIRAYVLLARGALNHVFCWHSPAVGMQGILHTDRVDENNGKTKDSQPNPLSFISHEPPCLLG